MSTDNNDCIRTGTPRERTYALTESALRRIFRAELETHQDSGATVEEALTSENG